MSHCTFRTSEDLHLTLATPDRHCREVSLSPVCTSNLVEHVLRRSEGAYCSLCRTRLRLAFPVTLNANFLISMTIIPGDARTSENASRSGTSDSIVGIPIS